MSVLPMAAQENSGNRQAQLTERILYSTMIARKYGPNHEAVDKFIVNLREVPWFSRVGEPISNAEVIQVDFDFMVSPLKLHTDRYAPWGPSLTRAETRIVRSVLDHRRLDYDMAVSNDVRIRGIFYHEDIFNRFFNNRECYPQDLPDPEFYAAEPIAWPDRLLRGAGCEIMLADVDPTLNFFRSLIPWLERGHWPCGWEGDYPDGKLIIW